MQSLDTIQTAECPVLFNKSDVLVKGIYFLHMSLLTNFVPMICCQVFWMTIISNGIAVIVVLVPPISAITGTRCQTWGVYTETNQKQIEMEEWEREANGYNKNNLIQFFSAQAYVFHTHLFLILQ